MIEIHHLAKRYGAIYAVKDLSLTLEPGEILGFLGPNGAGKSTTMRMLTGYLAADSGKIVIHGIDVAQNPIAAQKLIGYLPEGAPSYDDMLVEKFLLFIAEVRGFYGSERKQVVAQAVDKMDLRSVLQQKISTLSKGFKRRVGLAQAILHDPKVLILDEPTDGLDPNQKHQVRSLIKGLATDKIVIISTHILEEVTAVCTRAVILAEGRLLEDCTPAELEQRSAYHSAVTVIPKSTPDPKALASFDAISGVNQIDWDGRSITLFPNEGVSLFDSVKAHCGAIGLELESIYLERGRLDDVFRQITQGDAA